MNKAILHGNVGKDPVIKKLGETSVANFSIATQSFRKDQSGNKVTDWHNIVAWGKLAELSEKYIKKGSAIIVEGEIQYRNYDNKDGQKVYITEISASAIHFTGKKESESKESEANFVAKDEFQGGSIKEQIINKREELPEDDLPF